MPSGRRHLSPVAAGRDSPGACSLPKSQPAINSTPSVLGLILVIVVAHVLRILLPPTLSVQVLISGGFAPSEFLALLLGQPVPLPALVLVSPLSYALLHGGFLHIFTNIAFLLAFGTVVDRRIGGLPFLVLFALSTIAGAFFMLGIYLVNGVPLVVVGASGGISGLFGALVRFALRRQAVAIIVFIGVNILISYTGFASFGEVQQVAGGAHIGGFLAGWLLLPLFDPWRRRPLA